jgi:hypothetical protein
MHSHIPQYASARLATAVKHATFRLLLVLAVLAPPTVQARDLQRQQLAYFCTEAIAPDQLVIAGGVGAKSISPAQAGAQIDLRINAIRALVMAKQGRLVLQDRLRAARNPDQRERKPGDELLPFLQIQRFEAILPVRSDIDQVLESLFKAGMDRYGKNVRINEYSDHSFATLTRYRFSALKPKLDALVARCRAAKLTSICQKPNTCEYASGYATLSAKYPTEEGQRDMTLNLTGDAMLARITDVIEPSSASAIEFELQGTVVITRAGVAK